MPNTLNNLENSTYSSGTVPLYSVGRNHADLYGLMSGSVYSVLPLHCQTSQVYTGGGQFYIVIQVDMDRHAGMQVDTDMQDRLDRQAGRG